MRRLLVLFCVCLLLTACAGQFTPPGLAAASGLDSAGFAGTWLNQNGSYFHLDPGGKLGLPGQTARSGLTWFQLADKIFLNTLDTPGGSPRQMVLTVTNNTRGSLELINQEGQIMRWDKQPDLVGVFTGTASYASDINLPTDVIVRSDLYASGQDVPLATALSLVNNPNPDHLDYCVYYLKAEAPADVVYQLRVSVFYETECLLSLAHPIIVNLAARPHVRLEPGAHGYKAPEELTPPMQYRGTYYSSTSQTTITLFLEADGLYLLELESTQPGVENGVTVGDWRQISRNHSLQLGLGSQEPLTAALNPLGSLLFSHPSFPDGALELHPAVLPFSSTSFDLKGNYYPKDNTLLDCSSGIVFSLKADSAGLSQAIQAHAASGQGADSPILLDCQVRLSPQSANSDALTNAHQLELLTVRQVLHGETCGEPYASVDLENTYWRLVSLNSQLVSVTPELSEPHLILRSDQQAVGSDGCNNFFLPWQTEGDQINFEAGSSTLMICANGADLATAMHEALQNAESWKIIGKVLDLNANGISLATFEAVEL